MYFFKIKINSKFYKSFFFINKMNCLKIKKSGSILNQHETKYCIKFI